MPGMPAMDDEEGQEDGQAADLVEAQIAAPLAWTALVVGSLGEI